MRPYVKNETEQVKQKTETVHMLLTASLINMLKVPQSPATVQNVSSAHIENSGLSVARHFN